MTVDRFALIAVLVAAGPVGAQPVRPAPAGLAPRAAAVGPSVGPEALPASRGARVVRGRVGPPRDAVGLVSPDSVAGPRRRRAPYILTGALLGGVALGGAVLHSASRTDDAFFVGPSTAAAVGVGAIVGGVIGWAAAAARH